MNSSERATFASHEERRLETQQSQRNRLGLQQILRGLVLCAILSIGTPTDASNWLFQRSYYSHRITQAEASTFPRPNHRSAYRRPVYDSSPGFAIRGGHRYNRFQLRSGSSTDVTIFREDWVQER